VPVNSLRKHEILRKKQLITTLFRSRRSLKGGYVKIVYAHLDTGAEHRRAPAAVLFAVGRKSFRDAVSRNRIKRLLREAYRHEKHILIQNQGMIDGERSSRTLCLAFIYSGSGGGIPALADLQREISRLLCTIKKS
jgi:ribonuclease P protein component